MMIRAMAVSKSYGNKGTAFTIFMNYEKYRWTRSVYCDRITSNVAEIKAVEYILLSIAPEFYKDEINININGRYAVLMLNKKDGEWAFDPRQNTDLINSIRELIEKFKNLTITSSFEDNTFKNLIKMNEEAVWSKNGVFERITK